MTISSRRRALRRGFTLIELLLVLVILALLATIVVPKLAGRGEDARKKAAQSQISMFDTAMAMFEIDNGRYPTTEEGLKALLEQPANCPNWKKGGYVDGVPNDPWEHPYKYVNPGNHPPKAFDIYSFGPDGVEGTEDDIGNWEDR